MLSANQAQFTVCAISSIRERYLELTLLYDLTRLHVPGKEDLTQRNVKRKDLTRSNRGTERIKKSLLLRLSVSLC
jgi:hypothetical protein